jgi:hypothetical protein
MEFTISDITKKFNNIFENIENKQIYYINDNIIFTLICEKKIIFTLEITEQNFEIDSFSKCNQVETYFLLNQIINFAKELKLKTITLLDKSYIIIDNYTIDLPMLYILLYGYSWYNKFEFLSLNYENEILINKDLCSYNFNDFIFSSCEEKKKKITIFTYEQIDTKYSIIEDTKLLEIQSLNCSASRLTKYYNNMLEIYKILNPDYIEPDIDKINQSHINSLIKLITDYKIIIGEDYIKSIIEHEKEIASIKINEETEFYKNKINELFLQFIDKLKKKDINEILLIRIKEKYSDDLIEYNITYYTPIKNIVRIICFLHIETELLVEITDIAKYLLIYCRGLIYTL